MPLEHLPARGFRASEHALRKAFEWFDGRVAEYVKKVEGEQGLELAKFVEALSDKLFFTVITVTDELNAYKVFETLNARGVRLSATDLLKNYLFSVLSKEGQHEHEMKSLENRWEGMVGRLGSESFPDFLRAHWNSRQQFVRHTELFKTIRNQVSTREAVFSLIRSMEEDLDAYLSLTSPETSDWPDALKSPAVKLRLFGVRQPIPFLLAARRVFSNQELATVMHACVVISFRYNVISNLQAGEQEHVYNSVAARISSGELAGPQAVLGSLKSIYASDEAFRPAFSEKALRTSQTRNRRIVRYILCSLEKHLSAHEWDFDSNAFNIEHILPESPEKDWDAFSDADAESMTFRLGNMTLLGTGENRDCGNGPFSVKREAYAKSSFGITRKIATDNADWTPERLAARQRWMATQAAAIWRVAQLS